MFSQPALARSEREELAVLLDFFPDLRLRIAQRGFSGVVLDYSRGCNRAGIHDRDRCQ